MIQIYAFEQLAPEQILNRDIRAEKNVEDVVDAIIADVRARGDAALVEYAKKFDGADLTEETLQVTQAELNEALAGMDPYFLETLRMAAANIEAFHRRQVHKNFVVNDQPGVVLAVSTNDGLSASGENIARLMQRKHYYFVPYGQDDWAHKPQSLKAHLELVPRTLEAALRGEQLQPVLRGWE